MRHFSFLFFLTFLSFSIKAQNFSNKGKDFWVAYGYHVKMNATNQGNAQDMVLYFATEEVTNITITIPSLGYTQTLTSGAAPTVLTSDPIPKTGIQDARLTAESITPENKAIHIVSDKPIVAYAHIYNSSISGACILFPTNTLGKEYYSINYTQISNENNTNAWFYVIASDTGTTTVEITPSANTINHPAGVPFTITMTQGQVFNLMGQLTGGGGGGGGGGGTYTGVDLTGSKIKSIASGNSACKRIAVYSGSGKLSITCGANSSSSDNYMVQAFPKDAWGKKFLTVPTSSLINNVFRICVLDPTTSVTLNGAPIPYPLINNFYYEVPVTSSPMKIESNSPITVAQYISSQGACGNPNANTNPGDPEVIYLSPVEQNISRVLWNATPNFNINEHYYNVVIPNGGTAISSFTLDGVAVSPALFTVHPQDPAYSYLSTQLTFSGVHTIESDSGFNAIAYGFGAAESYGYNAGTNIKPFVPIRAYNPLNISGSTVACSGTNAYLTLTFPFQPTSLNIDFNNSLYQTPNTNVSISDPTTIFDSVYTEGSQQYWCYTLPTFYYFNVNNPSLDSSSYQISISGNTNSVEGCGNFFSADYDLFVYNPAKVKFAWANNGCVNDPVSFTDITNYSNNTFSYIWNWDFDDSNTSTEHNPSHLFTSPGTYNVNFSTVTNVGCVSDTTISVTVYPLSYGTVSGTTAVCANSTAPTITFNATSGTSPFVFNYTINGGAQSLTSTNSSATVTAPTSTTGIFNYTLNSIQGAACLQLQNTTPSVITVNPLPTATIAGTTAVCQNATSPIITFTGGGATAPYAFSYKLNNGPTQTIVSTGNVATINAPTNIVGTFTYTLLNVVDASSTACAQTQTGSVVITVNPLPTATISGTTALCLNATAPDVEFIGANGTAPYTFTYNINGGPSLTVTTTSGNSVLVTAPTSVAGVYNYQLISLQDASSTQCIQNQTGLTTITVYREPLANFSFNPPACPERTIQFNDLSIPYSGTITEWYWNFGDATPIVNTQNPIHNFALPGTYQVKLYIKTSNDCFSPEITIPVTINPLPIVGFINPEVCLSDTYAQFNDTSSVAGGTIISWQWNFSDPISGALNTSTLQNPRHSYSTIGTKNVKLIVTTNSGCVDTIVQSFFVNGDIPVAGFQVINPTRLCANDSVRIKNTSTVNVGSVVRVQIYWDVVGNPTVFETDELPFPNKVYPHLYTNFQNPLTRTYKIRFRAYSGETCINDVFQDITINAAPKVQFNVIPDTCRYISSFQITQASEIGGVPGTFAYSGPGISTAGIFNPTLTGDGTFTLHYVFTSNRGCSDSADKNIKILVPPVANFGYVSPFCEGRAITFTDTSSAPVGSITTWTWNFNDATPVLIRNVNTNFSHTFATAGIYNVQLIVKTNNGCNSLQRTKELLINPQPVASFRFTDTACLPNARIQFNNNSFIADGTQNTFSYLWNFGDAGSGALNASVAMNPSHIYNTTGPYNVKLKVTSGAFCVDDTIISVNTIHPQPIADFNFTKPSVCIGDNVKMNDISNPLDGTVIQWYWNFGDGSSSIAQQASHTYNSIGLYNVMHYITNSYGCVSDTMNKPFNVYPYPVASAGPDLEILEGSSAPLQATATGTGLNYIWTSNTYLNNTTVLNPICTPINDITYTLTVTGIGGCPTLDQVRIVVLKMPLIPNTFSPNKDGVNDTWDIQYLKDYPKAKIQIFTRTGQLVFESAGYLKPWDGTKSGKPLPVDTYYYIIEPESGRAPVTGYVTIIK